MIKKLNNQDSAVARSLYHVFQASYAVEAKILKVVDFPPLSRTLDEYLQTNTEFYGCQIDNALTAVVEIKEELKSIHIQSLVVDPQYFRQGLASQLMTFVMEKFNNEHLFVETGIDNKPAIGLYEKFGFKQVKQWQTNHGIIKVRLDSEQ